LLDRFDQTIASTNLTQLSTRAESGGKQVVDYAFWRAVLFVVIVLLAFLVYRFVSARLLSGQR
jgi:type IV secretory pathway TrbL component